METCITYLHHCVTKPLTKAKGEKVTLLIGGATAHHSIEVNSWALKQHIILHLQSQRKVMNAGLCYIPPYIAPDTSPGTFSESVLASVV